MMAKKKGAAHLEIIIAFTLFISFTFFLLYFIQFPKQNRLAETSLEILQSKFEQDNYINLTRISIKTNSSGCFSVAFNTIDGNLKSLVRDTDGDILHSKMESSNIINIDSSKNFFIIYLSSDFLDSSSLSCDRLLPSNYTIGGIEKSTILSYKRLNSLVADYRDNYLTLKTALGIPQNLEFAIKSNIKGFSLEGTQQKEDIITAKTASYPVLYSDGRIEIKEFTFEIW